ncbi:hypothetical protein RHSIM_Rhsim12G0064200 [Rhododendron simsii]|uniref:MYB-CC type transcription factor LHEQLE-containing domain-containing protein n=1 Tax=Rhododendron simsii TaxID=118357 RepID=A0A834L8F1_RHOSS|nr:hypothetical protein RHSIM_Rhsim12G0064200 [Rhododendron simsii]
MGHHQNKQNQDTHLVLSSDPKPRLKWTPELHRRFADAISQLGGADSYDHFTVCLIGNTKSLDEDDGNSWTDFVPFKEPFTGTSLNIGWGKATNQRPIMKSTNKVSGIELGYKTEIIEAFVLISRFHFFADYKGNQRRDADFLSGEVGDQIQNPINESLKIAQTLQMQMEVQRKLHEQIELRIEAQGKYLQSVLKKAQETLSGYSNSSSPIGVEIAKAELSELVSMVDNGGPSSSVSVLTEEKSGNSNSVVLSLMDLHPNRAEKDAPSNQGSGRKRSGSTISDGNNCGSKAIDLN